MTYTIAIAGKGGTGKTAFAGLAIDALVKKEKIVLAVDADPNANLNEVLGVKTERHIADIREEVLKQTLEYQSLPKDRFIDYLVHRTLVETTNIDLLVMGRPEGKKCYCFVNNLLRKHLDVISNSYQYIMVDNEAGMEHLSRMTTRDVDLLVILSDASLRGVRTAARIRELVEELNIPVKQQILAINKIQEDNKEILTRQAEEFGFETIIVLPLDKNVMQFDEEGVPLVNLPVESPLKKAVIEFVDKLVGQEFSQKKKHFAVSKEL